MVSFFQKLFFLGLRLASNRTRLWYARRVGVQVGQGCRLYSADFGSEPYLISFGNHVTVSAQAAFITHDGGVWVLRDLAPGLDDIRPIVVEDNVFIGMRALVLPGVVIGADSVVAAGAVVTKSVPPGTIVAGVPARVIGTREAYAGKNPTRIQTKGLSPAAKRAYLLQLWGTTPAERRQRLQAQVSAGPEREQP